MAETTSGFTGLGIAPKFLEILYKNKLTQPTPIQLRSIPVAIQGKDLMGIAQTGTGKTFAFGIPMIQRLAQDKNKKGLVIVPTRELAIQVDESLKRIGLGLGLKTAVLIGGEAMSKQFRLLKRDPHIIIATPGRLTDHMENNGLVLHNVGILVLDEADRMLDMGFAPQIQKILAKVPKHRQTMLFSATMPEEIVKLANSYLSTPLRVEVAPAGSAVKSVTQELFYIDRNEKNHLLKTILSEYDGSVLVFSRTKHKARDVARIVRNMGHTSTEIHSNRSLGQRKQALEGFKLGRFRVMVATDIAARGIDVSGIQLVVNYDLPATAEDYVHRIGRTGRAGLAGHAITFATHDQKREVRNIERLIRKTLDVSKPKFSGTAPEAPAPARKSEFRPNSEFKPRSREFKSREFKPREFKPRTGSGNSSYKPKSDYKFKDKKNRFDNKGPRNNNKRFSSHRSTGHSHSAKPQVNENETIKAFYMTRKSDYSDE